MSRGGRREEEEKGWQLRQWQLQPEEKERK
uniref:Uncharacterized protein n=1 Tax=Musa acuminata subsp. malaccensis TaxID=214687 RepID=A0A804JWP7_MUSAM